MVMSTSKGRRRRTVIAEMWVAKGTLSIDADRMNDKDATRSTKDKLPPFLLARRANSKAAVEETRVDDGTLVMSTQALTARDASIATLLTSVTKMRTIPAQG